MDYFETKYWIKNFFGIYNLLKNQSKFRKSLKLVKKHKILKINKQVNILFKNLIFELIKKLGKISEEYSKFKFNFKVNQQQLLKCFIEGKFLKNALWLFKYRKYFPKTFRLKNNNIKLY